jgi:hypothetical protein
MVSGKAARIAVHRHAVKHSGAIAEALARG